MTDSQPIPVWLKLHSFIDAKDSMSDWCVAQVLEIDLPVGSVTVNMDGWGAKWNSTYPLQSSKLAPFRKHSQGYTGPKRTTLRNWSFALCEVTEAISALEALLAQDLLCCSAFATTQFYRGTLPILVENLLIHDYGRNLVVLKYVVQLFSLVLEMVLAWLRRGPELFTHYSRGQATPGLYLEDNLVALASAWFEVIDILNKLFALDNRVSKFFMHYDEVPADYESCELTVIKNVKYSNTLTYLINKFAKEGGFQAILDLLHNTHEQGRVPFPFVAQVLLYALHQFLDTAFSARFFTEFTQAIFQRIEMVSDSELKDLKHDEIVLLLSKMSKLSVGLDGPSIELNKLALFLKMLKSTYLEKRVKGLNEINSMIEHIELLQPEEEDRPHLELTKRIGTVLRFLARLHALAESDLELLWQSGLGKHESFIRASYSAIVETTPYLEGRLNDFLFTKLCTVPHEEYDAHTLQVVKDFTMRAIEVAYGESLAAQEELDKWYGLGILKDFMFNEKSSELAKAATKYIGEILAATTYEVKRASSINELLALIRAGEHVDSAMKLLMKLVDAQNIKDLQREHCVKQLVISSIRDCERQQLRGRLRFLKFLAAKDPEAVVVTASEFNALWELLVCSGWDVDGYFEWLYNDKKLRSPITYQEGKQLFQSHFLCTDKFVPSQVTLAGYKCFCWLFLIFNHHGNALGMQYSKFRLRRAQTVPGLEQLVSIQLESSSAEVSSEATKLLVGLLTKYDNELFPRAPEILEEFTCGLFAKLTGRSEDEALVTRGLHLLKALLGDAQADGLCKTSQVYVKRAGCKDFKQIYVDLSRNMRHLRKEVAALFEEPLETTTVKVQDKYYGPLDDDVELKAFKFFLVTAEFTDLDYRELDPSETLSKNQEIITYLFSLLSCAHKPYTDLAWELLMALPTNKALRADLKALDRPLAELLDQDSQYKLLYELTVLQKLSEKPKWAEDFILKGGFEYLLAIYTAPRQLEHSKFSAKFESKIVVALGNLLRLGTPELLHSTALSRALLESVHVLSAWPTESDAVSFFWALKTLFLHISEMTPEVLPALLSAESALFSRLFTSCLIENQDPSFSHLAWKLLAKLTQKNSVEEEMLQLLLRRLKEALKSPVHSKSYWELLAYLIACCSASDALSALSSQLVALIEQSPGERNSAEKDAILGGVMKVLTGLFKLLRTPPSEYHFDLFLHRCLFEVPNQAVTYSLCKHQSTRKKTFILLHSLCAASPQFLSLTVNYLRKFHQEPQWRTAGTSDWSNSSASEEKSETGYVGLENLGCTCYMNSLLQQLYMIPSWRESILQVPQAPDEDSILWQLQYVFTGLKRSDKQHIVPKGLTKAFKDFEGNPINVQEQMDVDEFFSTFMDRLEELVAGSPQERTIKNHFGGLQVTELIGKDCTHRSERQEPFLSISIEVKNKSSLLQGLESFVEGELLEGENAYQCDHCDAKVTALRRVCVKHLPNYLALALRRFEFDFDTMKRNKVNDFYEFPQELDMEPYTQEGLERLEKDSDAEKKFPEEYYKYQLRGVVIHMGTADSGHYYSFIHDKGTQSWYEFNDTWVRRISPEDIPNECFGGQEKYSWALPTASTQISGMKEKYGNAYLLFYERKTLYKPRDPDDEEIAEIQLSAAPAETSEHCKTIEEENHKYWHSRHTFSEEYSFFVSQLSTLPGLSPKFIIEYFLTIMIRMKEKSNLITIYQYLEAALSDSALSEWFLELLTYTHTLKELLIYNPVYLMRRLVVCLADNAAKLLSPAAVEHVFLRLLSCLQCANKKTSKNYAQYLELLRRLITHNEWLVDKYELVSLLVQHLIKGPLELPEPPANKHEDIYLGYDLYQHSADELKGDSIFYDPQGCCFSHSYQLLYTLRTRISQEDRQTLLTKENTQKALKDAETKTGAWWAGALYAHLCADDKDATFAYLRFLFEQFTKAEHYGKARVFKLFTTFLLEADSLQAEKIGEFLKFYFKLLQAAKYPSEIEQALNYLFKISSKAPQMRQLIVERHTQDMDKLQNWIANNTKVTYSVGKGGTSSYEEFERASFKTLMAKAQLLTAGDVANATDWDSDQELEERLLGSEVDVLDSIGQTWRRGKVEQRLGELVLVKYSQASAVYSIWKDSAGEDIAVGGTRTGSP